MVAVAQVEIEKEGGNRAASGDRAPAKTPVSPEKPVGEEPAGAWRQDEPESACQDAEDERCGEAADFPPRNAPRCGGREEEEKNYEAGTK